MNTEEKKIRYPNFFLRYSLHKKTLSKGKKLLNNFILCLASKSCFNMAAKGPARTLWRF